MRLRYWVLPIVAAFLAGPTWGQQNQLSSCPANTSCTIWGGFEDTVAGNSDYDYNDLVFSLTGNGLTLGTIGGTAAGSQTGGLFAKPTATLNQGDASGSLAAPPFWNNPSQDGTGGKNVGWCIYGGGACGAGLAPNDAYAAASGGRLRSITLISSKVPVATSTGRLP